MRHLSFKILIVFIFLPPLFYMVTTEALERYFTDYYAVAIEERSAGDTEALLAGTVALEDAVVRNVAQFLEADPWPAWGVGLTPTVATKKGLLLYPAYYQAESGGTGVPDPTEIAIANFALLQEGLAVDVTVKLNPLGPLGLAVLLFYGLFAGGGLYAYLSNKSRQARREEEKQARQLANLEQLARDRQASLAALEGDKSRLNLEIGRVRAELEAEQAQANRNEDELFEEIGDLEQQLEENRRRQAEREAEIEELKSQLLQLSKEQENIERQKTKAADALTKRFAALYKNLDIGPRAINGLLSLPEEMKIKAEEVIHQLDAAPQKVTIKRKVFGKKGREPVLEVLFAYNGRLYFRNLKDNRREVVVIGNKNSQSKDLAYIESISRKASR